MAPDADCPTIHIRCGSDIFLKLREAGFTGELLEFSDPVCMGPVPDGPGLLQVRGRFVTEAIGQEGAESRLRAEADALEAARLSAARIVLWFEHDSYDQLVLARVLAALAGRPGVELICIATHPRPARFIGLGQLTASDLLELWPARAAVGPAEFELGTAVWRALRLASPEPLHAIALGGTPAIPAMAGALLRHLQELPWVGDGLSLTERLILQAIRDGARTAGSVFSAAQRMDPLPFMGDMMLLAVIRDLAAARVPALELGPGACWRDWPVGLTASGAALLEADGDWQLHGPPTRWVGGIQSPAWRWAGRPVSG